MASLSRHQKRNTEEKGSFLRKFSSYFNFATPEKRQKKQKIKLQVHSCHRASIVFCALLASPDKKARENKSWNNKYFFLRK
jgi:hypothetical protein